MRNQFLSINTFEKSYDYIITLIRRGKIQWSLFENWMVLIYKTLRLLHLWMFCAKCDWNLPSILEEIFKFRHYTFAISLLSPLRKGLDPSFEQNWIPFIQGCFVLGWNWPSASGKEDENVKSLQTDGRRTTGDQKSSLELSVQVR